MSQLPVFGSFRPKFYWTFRTSRSGEHVRAVPVPESAPRQNTLQDKVTRARLIGTFSFVLKRVLRCPNLQFSEISDLNYV